MSVRLSELLPNSDEAFISAACGLHEMERRKDARAFFLSGPESLRRQTIFHNNLACDECCLSHLEVARAHLTVSFRLSEQFRREAEQDRDVEALCGDLASLEHDGTCHHGSRPS